MLEKKNLPLNVYAASNSVKSVIYEMMILKTALFQTFSFQDR